MSVEDSTKERRKRLPPGLVFFGIGRDVSSRPAAAGGVQ